MGIAAAGCGAVTLGLLWSGQNYAKPIHLANLHRSINPLMAHHAADTSRLMPLLENRRAAQHPVGRQALAPWLREWDLHARGHRGSMRELPAFSQGIGTSFNRRLKDVHHGFHEDLEWALHDDERMKELHEEWKQGGGADGRLAGIAKPDTRESGSRDKKAGST